MSVKGFRFGGVISKYDFAYLDNSPLPLAECDTAGSEGAKVAASDGYTLASKSYVAVIMENANSYEDKITLNINSTGAKDIYINGVVSSDENYTLPAGTYIVSYDDNKYYFYTDAITLDGSTFGSTSDVADAFSNS